MNKLRLIGFLWSDRPRTRLACTNGDGVSMWKGLSNALLMCQFEMMNLRISIEQEQKVVKPNHQPICHQGRL
jgi:hypothetical protein